MIVKLDKVNVRVALVMRMFWAGGLETWVVMRMNLGLHLSSHEDKALAHVQ